MGKEDFYKGQTIWVYLIGNAARGREIMEERIQEWEVVTVGRKYITAQPKGTYNWEQKFDIQNNFQHVYDRGTADYELHLSKEEIYEQVERAQRIRFIEDFCRWDRRNIYRMNDEDLREIVRIFERYEK